MTNYSTGTYKRTNKQCSGSAGSVSFVGIPNPDPLVRGTDSEQILPSPSKKNLFCRPLYDLFSLKNDKMYFHRVIISQKLCFVGVLMITDEKSKIRSRIRQAEVRIHGIGSVPKISRIRNTARKVSIGCSKASKVFFKNYIFM
jgi:hypothetical protein